MKWIIPYITLGLFVLPALPITTCSQVTLAKRMFKISSIDLRRLFRELSLTICITMMRQICGMTQGPGRPSSTGNQVRRICKRSQCEELYFTDDVWISYWRIVATVRSLKGYKSVQGMVWGWTWRNHVFGNQVGMVWYVCVWGMVHQVIPSSCSS